MRVTGILRYAAAAITVAMMSSAMVAQAPAAGAPRQMGTVKSATATSLTLTTATGDYMVALPDGAKILVVPPGSKDLKSATPGTAADVATGDKAIVTGSASDSGKTLTATRVILMKADAIAQSHAASDAAWAQGTGGIVKSVNVAASKVELTSGGKTVIVVTTPATVVRHYSGDSVSFGDAKVCALADVKPGDQLRVRGSKAMDGLTITADEMVAGTFRNYSGLLTAVDATAGTVTLKDLATKKTVTVSVTGSSDVRRIAPQMAQMIAARMKATSAPAADGATAPAAAPGAGVGAGVGAGGYGARGAGRGGADLSQMLSRLPKDSTAGLKVGEAVMIVASSSSDATKSSAVTLVVGVEPLLTAAPSGEMVLSPWSIGGAPGGDAGGGL